MRRRGPAPASAPGDLARKAYLIEAARTEAARKIHEARRESQLEPPRPVGWVLAPPSSAGVERVRNLTRLRRWAARFLDAGWSADEVGALFDVDVEALELEAGRAHPA